MPQIDLAQATVRILDGYAILGAVNDVSPPAAGDTAITIDGFTVALPVGARISFAGHEAVYTVVSSVGGSTPTSVTITPALEDTLADDEVVTVGPHMVEIKLGEGNLTYEEKKAYEYVRDKRRIAFVRTGDEDPMEVSIDAIWEYISSPAGATVPTIEEAMKKKGAATAWVTSGADPCEPYSVDIEIDYVPPCADVENARERITLKEYRYESLNHNIKDGTISTRGMCKITEAVAVRY